MLPIITHFAEGGEVQYNTGTPVIEEWEDCPSPNFDEGSRLYRIKPTPRVVLRTSDDPELVWLKGPSGTHEMIVGYGHNHIETKSWCERLQYFHDEGFLCSATRNGPWLPLVKEEIV